MSRLSRAMLMLALGAVGCYLVFSGAFGAFLQQRMRLPLLAGSLVLVVFGVYETRMSLSNRNTRNHQGQSHVHGHSHDHEHETRGPAVGWLLALPLIVLVSVAPSALGASATGRVQSITPPFPDVVFEPIEDSDAPIEMRIWEFLDRAIWDETESLDGLPVRLEGLVVNDPIRPGEFKLTRFLVNCCAADGIPIQVVIHGAPTYPDDTWVVLDAVWRPPPQPYDTSVVSVRVEADLVTVVALPETPDDPYEAWE